MNRELTQAPATSCWRALLFLRPMSHVSRLNWKTFSRSICQTTAAALISTLPSCTVLDSDKIKPPFDQLDQPARFRLLSQLRDVAIGIRGTFFAVVIDKSYLGEDEDQYGRALEQMLSRFDQFLSRVRKVESQLHLGLVVIAHSSDQKRLEVVLNQLAEEGTQWGELRNLVDVPFFRLAKNSRMLQVSDLIANGVYGRYEADHARFFDRMLPKFDQDNSGRMHGLLHLTANRSSCYLPCCLTRRLTSGA